MKSTITSLAFTLLAISCFCQVNQGWENDDWVGQWEVPAGVWEIGTPANGPDAAFEGAHCAGTSLTGNYTDDTEGRLVSPSFQVPAASEIPRLRFLHWYSFTTGDYGQVQIKPEGGDWTPLSPEYSTTGSNAWSAPLLSLEAFAGQTVQIGFFFQAENIDGGVPETSSGWFIDNVEIGTGPLVFNNPETFDGGFGDWSADTGTWEVGEVSGHQDRIAAGTALNDNYDDERESRLISPPVQLPQADQIPRLRFLHLYSFSSGDYGQVIIKPEGGDWMPLSPEYRTTSSDAWSSPLLSLEEFAGQIVQIGFLFHSENVGGGDPETSSGWFIDNVEISTGPLVFNNPETFENGFGDWVVDAGTWEVGEGPSYQGQGVAGTVLNGNYHDERESRLISPPVQIPQADQNPRLRFWHRYSFSSGDHGQVLIRPEGGDWTPLSPEYSATSSGAWSYPLLSLEEFGGQTVQIAFLFQSENVNGGAPETSIGWFIDNVEVSTGPLVFNNPETFEDGIGDWTADAGTWEVGEGRSYQGQNAAATVLNGNYQDDSKSRLISPPVQLPQADQQPRLRFWHWYSFSTGDYGQVTIKPEGGDWTPLSSEYRTTSSNAWSYPLLSLGEFAGQTVQIGFLFHSENVGGGIPETSSGWFIDNVEIVTGALVFNNPETFEDGIGDWSVEAGTWEVGTPTVGPENTTSGVRCAATVLDGNYQDGVDSRLLSVPFTALESISFQQWYAFAPGDTGYVELKVEGGDWQTIMGPFTGTTAKNWEPAFYCLSSAVGSTVQIAFRFKSSNAEGGNAEVNSGWYIDDFEAQVCTVSASLPAEKKEALPYALKQNYPNPFATETTIEYELQHNGYVRLEVCDLLGKTVKVLVDQPQGKGAYKINWDGMNQNGAKVSEAVYFYRLFVDGNSAVRKMVLY